MKNKYNKRAVRQYILNAIDPSGYGETPTTDAEKLAFLDKTFRAEYYWSINRIGYQASMREWLQGLPSAIGIEYRNHKILELAREWGSISDNPTDAEENKILDNWFSFIASHITMMIRK